ncbi:MAG: hypothetical protein ABIP51_23865 [Bacteroidia bacterium]
MIVQRFTPYDKVGARRWSKFIHYLQKNENLKISVLTQSYYSAFDNPWNVEFDKEKVDIIYINDFFSIIQKKFPLFNRLTYFIQYKLLKYTDEGYGFSKKAFKFLKEKESKITPTVIIASCPAFSTCYFAAKYKIRFPQKKVINDFRDAWIDGFFAWNKSIDASHPSYKKQVEMESFALNNCDIVVSVTPELIEKFKSKIKDQKVATHLITNGYDKRDYIISDLSYPVQFDKKKINICHFGTLDFGRDDEFLKLITASEIPENFVFFLIGTITEKLQKEIRGKNNIVYIKQLPANKLRPFLFYSDFHLIINDPEFYYAYGSKIFDAMLYLKPIAYISKENSLSSKYKSSKGFFYSDSSVTSNESLLKQMASYKYLQDEIPNYTTFEIENLAKEYYQLIAN